MQRAAAAALLGDRRGRVPQCRPGARFRRFRGPQTGNGTAEEKTVGFLIDQFRKLGLKPGNGESYLQAVPMVEMLPAGDPSLSVAGHGAPHALAYAKDMVIWSERAMPEAALERSELVFAGYGIVAQDYAWDDYAGLDVHGKTVVVLVNDPGHDAKDPRVFRGDAETRYGRWDYKVDEAARHGAAGVLLIHDAGAAGYGWNVVLNERTGALLAAPTPDDAARPAVAGWLSAASTIDLFKRAGLDFAALRAAAARPGFKGVDLGLTVDARVHNTIRHFTSSNVVAVLPGARHKPEYVVYTAHWDALGRQSAAAGGALLNGAVDDASGVAGLLMLAQSLSRTRPQAERSAVFIAFTGEASGLIGSRYYVDNPVFPLRRTAGVLSLDALAHRRTDARRDGVRFRQLRDGGLSAGSGAAGREGIAPGSRAGPRVVLRFGPVQFREGRGAGLVCPGRLRRLGARSGMGKGSIR